MREYTMKRLSHLAVPLAALVLVTTPARADSDFYTENEILNAARGFFGGTTGGLAKAVSSKPNVYPRRATWASLKTLYPRRGSGGTLVYNIKGTTYPGVSSFYFVAGVGVNYQQAGDVIPGSGLRGANVGFYITEKSIPPV